MHRRTFIGLSAAIITCLSGCTDGSGTQKSEPKPKATVEIKSRSCESSDQTVSVSRGEDDEKINYSGVIINVPSNNILEASLYSRTNDDGLVIIVQSVDSEEITDDDCSESVEYSGKIDTDGADVGSVRVIHDSKNNDRIIRTIQI